MWQPLQGRVIQFLTSLPNINSPPAREALAVRASLDESLVGSIDFSGPTTQFVPLLVSRLATYGTLVDGRDALEKVLQVAKDDVGMEGRATCDAIIEEWRTSCPGTDVQNRAEGGPQENLDYQFDVFLSGGQDSIFASWVSDIFLHRFRGFLGECLTRPAKIKRFEAPSGFSVHPYTKIALVHSRCLVAICYPTYFKSLSRIYELSVMFQRERRLGYRTENNPTPLVFVVDAYDGDKFPRMVAEMERRCDCNGLTSPSVVHSERGVLLDDKIAQLAEHVADAMSSAPLWSKEFFDDLDPDSTISNALQKPVHLTALPRW